MKRLVLTAIFVFVVAVPTFAGEVPTVGIVGEVPTVGVVTSQPPSTSTTQATSSDSSTGFVATILLTIITDLIGR